MLLHADREDPDLSRHWVHRSFCWFCHASAHVVHCGVVALAGFCGCQFTGGTIMAVELVFRVLD